MWGNYADQPVPADYDGDGRTDYAIWRQTDGRWYIMYSSEDKPYVFTLGVPGDVAVASAYTKQVGGTVTPYEMAGDRLSPKNATGGTNLYSQNFGWGTSLVGLPGRSGLNAGFGMGYNSLVWIKSGSAMYFDPDTSNITPGFRFGYPTIEPVYYDAGKSLFAYMMVTPDGGRTEFRQLGASAVYETADSSYTQLVTTGAANPNSPVEDIHIKVTTTDGTQMSYEWTLGAFKCTQIKDRNGNYITIAYNTNGGLSTVTDTLGRVISVSYNDDGQPLSVTQVWKGTNGSGSNTTHTWAGFAYTTKTVDTDFSTSLSVFGPPDNTVVKVLDKITYADGSYTKFDYNGYLQVKKVRNYAADNHELNYVRTNLDNISGSPCDCPRFTDTWNWAENFAPTGANSNGETRVSNTEPTTSSFTGPNGSETTKAVTVTMANHPDELSTVMHFVGSGWREGLGIATEDFTGTTRKRWTWTNWEQDVYADSSTAYPINPRVTETRVGDGTNTKRTTIAYLADPNLDGAVVAIYGLVDEVKVFNGSSTSEVKKTKTTYNLSSNFLSRRIIGLPSKTEAWGHNDATNSLEYVSKVTYAYDEGGYTASGQSVSPVQHCTTASTTTPPDAVPCPTAYGTAFNYRGNLTSTKRWDATSPTNSSLAVESSVVYNTAGSPISQTDPRGRISTISYGDSTASNEWNDGVTTRNTLAYPTTVTDPGGFSSTIKYRFDTGANVWARSPKPEGSANTYGKTTSREYSDTTGRIIKEKIDNSISGAYTRYSYADSGNALTTYSTIIDVNNDGYINSTDEAATLTEFDGAGRVRRTRTENPNSTGLYTGKLIEYNILGQVKRESVPTEINSSWNPAGDDDRGVDTNSNPIWLWNSKEYDWKGRPTRTIPSDSTGTDGKDTLITYEGCGCAGGQVTTIKGPVTEAKDVAGNLQTTKRRTQKVYEDILGRNFKTELWDLDGGGSAPYSTTVNTFNGRDQVTEITQYAGTASSNNTNQTTSTTYDGHGRPVSLHKPEFYDTYVTSPTSAMTTYNADDTVATATDPRGAVTTYTFGNPSATEKRAVVTEIEYTPVGTMVDPPDVTFTYDAAGNRLTMADGTGTLAYTYDELSRMTSETKDFADTLDKELENGYTLTYNYHLSGGIKSIIDPFGIEMKYSADKVGRTTAIGTTANATLYASDIQYRAFGSIKTLAHTTTTQTNVSMTYNSALRPLTYEAESTVEIRKANYIYNNDGMLKEIDNDVDANFSQKNEYDFAGRLKKNDVGQTGVTHPFLQTMSYDAFNNLIARSNTTYTFDPNSFTSTYTDNRKTSGGAETFWDKAGNIVSTYSGSGTQYWMFDAAGQQYRWEDFGPSGNNYKKAEENSFDGDGRIVKRSEQTKDCFQGICGDWGINANWYSLYSSVTGQKVTEVLIDGTHWKTNVYLGITVIAEAYTGLDMPPVVFKATDPVSGSTQNIDPSGVAMAGEDNRNELAGLGTSVPITEPPTIPPHNFRKGGNPFDAEGGCIIDGFDRPPGDCGGIYGGYGAIITTKYLPVREPGDPDRRITVQFYDFSTRRITNGEMGILKKSITEAANNTDLCRKYVKDLIEKVAATARLGLEKIISSNIETLFKTVYESRGDGNGGGGIFLQKVEGSNAVNNWNWVGGPGSADVYLGFAALIPTIFYHTESRQKQAEILDQTISQFLNTSGEGGIDAIHELIHVAVKGVGDDEELAIAVADLAGEKFTYAPYDPTKPDSATNQPKNIQASNYWDARLKQACGFTNEQTRKITNYRLYK